VIIGRHYHSDQLPNSIMLTPIFIQTKKHDRNSGFNY